MIAGIALSFLAINAHDIKAIKGKVENGYNFWLATPPDAEEDEVGLPLVVFLHGRSLCGTNMETVKKYGSLSAVMKGREIDAYVIAPQNPGGSWSPEKVWNVIDYVLDECNVDTTRVYVLGMSLGGYGTIDVAAKYPDRIAAAIGMCGGATQKDLTGLAELPLWVIHGTGDASVNVSKSDAVVNAVKEAQKQGDGINRLIYDRIPGMNHSKPARLFYHPEIYEWLFEHSLEDPDRTAAPTPKLSESFFGDCYKGINWRK